MASLTGSQQIGLSFWLGSLLVASSLKLVWQSPEAHFMVSAPWESVVPSSAVCADTIPELGHAAGPQAELLTAVQVDVFARPNDR
jgi:hypothetical protein